MTRSELDITLGLLENLGRLQPHLRRDLLVLTRLGREITGDYLLNLLLAWPFPLDKCVFRSHRTRVKLELFLEVALVRCIRILH